MRLYVFVNKGMSGIQAGIQALHAATKLVAQTSDEFEYINDWALKHQTTCVLDGGDHASLLTIRSHLIDDCGLWDEEVSIFREETFNDSVTAVAIVADTKVCEYMVEFKSIKRNGILRKEERESSLMKLDHSYDASVVNTGKYLMKFRSHRG